MVYMDCNASARYTLSRETSLLSEVISSSITIEYPIPDFAIEALRLSLIHISHGGRGYDG